MFIKARVFKHHEFGATTVPKNKEPNESIV